MAKVVEAHGHRDAGCIFCRIVAGEIPCHKVYEDDEVLSFLDVGPIVTGHTLVIPKAHYRTVMETPAAVLAAVNEVPPLEYISQFSNQPIAPPKMKSVVPSK